MRKRITLFWAILISFLLAGCGLKSGEELYQLPKASAEYDSLQDCLQTMLDQGLEYSAPLTGSNLQPVQLNDLDHDGVDEAIAFFRDSSAESQSLKIYIFRQTEPDTYTPALLIEGNGTAINSAVFCQLEGSPDSMSELVISWQLSPTVYALSAYSLKNYTSSEMLSASTYTKYTVTDFDEDGNNEIVLIQLDSSDQSSNRAEYYTASNGRMEMTDSVLLSKKLGSVDRIANNRLSDRQPALYITGYVLNNDGDVSTSTVITDILTIRNGSLTNISMGAAGQNSSTTLRNTMTTEQDINSDGALEIPIPFLLESYAQPPNQENFYALHWQQYQPSGSFQIICSTFHNTADGWYLVFPNHWTGHISLMRIDNSSSSIIEHSIVFYYRGTAQEKPQPFLAIYKTTGSGQTGRMDKDNRFILRSDSDTIYSAELFDCDWDCGLSSETLAEQFHLIQPHWSND